MQAAEIARVDLHQLQRIQGRCQAWGGGVTRGAQAGRGSLLRGANLWRPKTLFHYPGKEVVTHLRVRIQEGALRNFHGSEGAAGAVHTPSYP